MKILVSYTYLTRGGNQAYAMDIIDPQTNRLTLMEAAYVHVRVKVSSTGVIFGAWLIDTDVVDSALGAP